MRLSESLRRGVLDSFVGGITNKFQMKSRRIVLIFEDILANYIKVAENAGYKKEMEDAGLQWTALAIQEFLPAGFVKIPISLTAEIGASIWRNLGLVDDLTVGHKNSTITIETKNEYITSTIGPNRFAVGAYKGILSALTSKNIECTESKQERGSCRYVFEIKNSPWKGAETKGKKNYDILNRKFLEKGHDLKEVARLNSFQIRNNNIFFRGYKLLPLENTLFSIIGNKSIMMGKVAEISNAFFKKIIRAKNIEEALPFLKKILQVMGWGIVKIVIKSEKEIDFEIKNMPYGLQKEPDNRDFLAFMLLGYLRVVDKKIRILNVCSGACLKIQFISR